MQTILNVLRAIIVPLGWICAVLALATPIWFAIAAFGTKWGFLDVATGLYWMTRAIGHPLLMACVLAGGAAIVLILVHWLAARRLFGAVVSSLLALAIGGAGLGWAWTVEQRRDALPPVLDVTTDRQDPPHFSPGFRARRPAGDQSLDYADKQAPDGRPLAALQADTYPDIATVAVPRAPEDVFARALDYAHEQRWRVGTASESAGMFEAGTESLWYGLRDDIVVRVREDGEGGSLVDIRSLSRDPDIHDLGRNARRVRDFSAAISET